MQIIILSQSPQPQSHFNALVKSFLYLFLAHTRNRKLSKATPNRAIFFASVLHFHISQISPALLFFALCFSPCAMLNLARPPCRSYAPFAPAQGLYKFAFAPCQAHIFKKSCKKDCNPFDAGDLRPENFFFASLSIGQGRALPDLDFAIRHNVYYATKSGLPCKGYGSQKAGGAGVGVGGTPGAQFFTNIASWG